VLIVVALTFVVGPFMYLSENSAAADPAQKVLFDMGNGETKWADINIMGNIDDVLRKAASDNGLEYSSSSGKITIGGITETTIGAASTGGTLSNPGTTGVKATASWVPFQWNIGSGKWEKISNIYSPYAGGSLAVGFFTSNQVPAETPEHQSSWTMIRGNSLQTGAQSSVIPDERSELKWFDVIEEKGAYAAVLSAQGHIFVKFGAQSGRGSETVSIVRCYTMDGDKEWEFIYPSTTMYELSTPVIVGDFIYIQSSPSSYGYIFKVPIKTGPGASNENVITLGNRPFNSVDINNREGAIPSTTATLSGTQALNKGPTSMVYDSGALFLGSGNGMMYCFDLDLKLIWSGQMGGSAYFISPTIKDDYLFAGAMNGSLYAFNKLNGTIIDHKSVYTTRPQGATSDFGSVNQIAVFKDGGTYTLMFAVSDGLGLSSKKGGLGIYEFNGSKLTRKALLMEDSKGAAIFGLMPNYVLPVEAGGFKGVYFTSFYGLFRVDTGGNYEKLSDLDAFRTVRAPISFVNNEYLFIKGYSVGEPIYVAKLDGTIVGTFPPESPDKPNAPKDFSMSPPLIIGGWVTAANDSGFNMMYGGYHPYTVPGGEETPLIYTLAMILAVILMILLVIYLFLRYVRKEEKPFNYIKKRVQHYIGGEDLRHNRRNKNRLKVVLLIGILITAAVFLLCLCVGFNAVLSLGDMFSALWSAITKGGADPSDIHQVWVFDSRLPRTIAALGVGIGLSIAGSMYQAIIRNPLVDPYIMGVSAGAGTAAVAVIAFNFTFFGLFSAHSIYATAIVAMMGGLIAFAATMFLAEKAGGKSINFVLAGVVVGLAFSSVQTLMMSMAGHTVANALSWLFGSFASVSWDQAWLILVPALVMACVPLIWAKEFNLVLLGEDQAQQMGLNVRWFNRSMLILASILTSICVAFVGIIGFVGLVIPHLCRMMLGGDHRLVLPTSIAFGGALMMLADLASRTLYLGQELPVGAITTMIGVPVFAYLLIRRGKMYDG